MRRLKLRRSLLSDAKVVADRLRQADRDEVAALTSLSPEQVLEAGIKTATLCTTFEVDDMVVAVAGVDGVPGETALAWLLGTVDIQTSRKAFVKSLNAWVKDRLKDYPRLINIVDASNSESVRWLESVGATFGESKYNLGGRSFVRFEIARN